MTHGLSNGHVTNDVTCPLKVKLVTPIRLERNISKMAGFRDSVPMDHQSEMTWVSNDHVVDDVTWPPKVLWGSTVGYPSDSLASCLLQLCMFSLLHHHRLSAEKCIVCYKSSTWFLLGIFFLIYVWFLFSWPTFLDLLQALPYLGHRREVSLEEQWIRLVLAGCLPDTQLTV